LKSVGRQLNTTYDASILEMEFTDAAPPKRQFCVVVFYQGPVDLNLFVLIGKDRSEVSRDLGRTDGRERKPALPILRQITLLAAKPQPTMGDSRPK
jgi:hypothetical protein